MNRGVTLSGQFHKYDDVFKEKNATDFTDFTEWDGRYRILARLYGSVIIREIRGVFVFFCFFSTKPYYVEVITK